MSKGVVLLGDKTTHGGAVISVSSTMIVNGKNVALIGDKISCPIIGHGINAIIEGSPEWSSDAKPLLSMAAIVYVAVRFSPVPRIV